MRIVHLDRPSGTVPFLPLCGDWGSPDADGTKDPRGVTCPACLGAMARVREAAPVTVSVPLRAS